MCKLGFILFKNFYLLAVLGLRCCTCVFSSCGEKGLLFFAVCGLLDVTSLIAEHGHWVFGLQELQRVGSEL